MCCIPVQIAVGQDAALVSAEPLCCRQILAVGGTAGLTHSQERPPRSRSFLPTAPAYILHNIKLEAYMTTKRDKLLSGYRSRQ